MWVYTAIGFFSAVENREDRTRKTLLVRARFREDIDRLAGRLHPAPAVVETPERDYMFRVVIPKTVWAKVMAELAEAIDYGNFKSAVHGDPVRDRAYMRSWSAMADAQEAAYESPPKARSSRY